MSKEAMKLAKAWFERNTYGDEAVDVYEALCAALAEQSAQQEPEWYHFVRYGEDCFVPYSGQAPEKATPLYTSPQRTWVGLTDEKIEEIAAITLFPIDFARAIEVAHGINE